MTVLLRSIPDLVGGLRDCVHERGMAYQTVDEIAGLPDRYTSKVLGPTPIKNIGPLSLEGILGATGKALVLVDDPEQITRVRSRWTPRKRPLKPPASACRLSIKLEIQPTPESQEQMKIRERMKLLGKMGGKASAKRRAKTMSKRARQRAAQHAARMRWSKSKSPSRTICD